ncbi:MAG: ABC transporter substrate-binding protein [Alphaproteobacteria bacterium]|nr:ABC transporter substrate-binding protein [Alphaproteobacteria bacterium]
MPVCRRSFSRALLTAAILGCGNAAAGVAPKRVMSLNICTDQLLLALSPSSRIASVTFMAREQGPLMLWPQAKAIPVNYGSAEEVLAAHPDLVLAGPFLPPLTKKLLTKSGAKVLQVPLAEDFAQIRSVTQLVARSLGEELRGEALIRQMDADLRAAAAHRPLKPFRVAEWGNGGQVPGGAGLFGALLRAAGAESIGGGTYDVEALAAARPQALLYSDSYRGLHSLRDNQDDHPALTGRLPHIYYSSFYGCGVPQLAGVALQLQRDLRQAVKP